MDGVGAGRDGSRSSVATPRRSRRIGDGDGEGDEYKSSVASARSRLQDSDGIKHWWLRRKVVVGTVTAANHRWRRRGDVIGTVMVERQRRRRLGDVVRTVTAPSHGWRRDDNIRKPSESLTR